MLMTTTKTTTTAMATAMTTTLILLMMLPVTMKSTRAMMIKRYDASIRIGHGHRRLGDAGSHGQRRREALGEGKGPERDLGHITGCFCITKAGYIFDVSCNVTPMRL